jgi:hypothetical protein
VLKHSLLQHDRRRVQRHYNTQVWNHHDTTGLHCNCTARKHTPKLTITIIPKVKPRSTSFPVVVHWQPSYQLKHHYPQVNLVGSVTAVQPASSDLDQTDPAAPLEVPGLEVAAVRPLWPARLQPAPQPPQPATAYQQCSTAASTSQSRERRHPPRGYEPLPRDPRSSEGGRLTNSN